MGPYFQGPSIWMGWILENSDRTSVPKWPLGYPSPPPEVTIDALSQFDAIHIIIPAYTSIFVLFLKHSWNTGLSMYHTVMANMGCITWKNAVFSWKSHKTSFHDRTSCKIHRGCVLMYKYTQIVPWSKIIVQKYDIICFRGNVYRAQSQNATVNFNFSRHFQFLHARVTK